MHFSNSYPGYSHLPLDTTQWLRSARRGTFHLTSLRGLYCLTSALPVGFHIRIYMCL